MVVIVLMLPLPLPLRCWGPLVLLVADFDPIDGGVPWRRFDEVFRYLPAVPRRLDCSRFLLGNVAIQVRSGSETITCGVSEDDSGTAAVALRTIFLRAALKRL